MLQSKSKKETLIFEIELTLATKYNFESAILHRFNLHYRVKAKVSPSIFFHFTCEFHQNNDEN